MLKRWFSGKKNLILLVEDEIEPAILLQEFLELQGYAVELAKDGIEGVALAKKIVPDLILLDIMLPGMDGMNVLLNIKSKPELVAIPIIMCTALNGIKEVERCCKWGAVGYITKPYELSRVLEKVSLALAERKPNP